MTKLEAFFSDCFSQFVNKGTIFVAQYTHFSLFLKKSVDKSWDRHNFDLLQSYKSWVVQLRHWPLNRTKEDLLLSKAARLFSQVSGVSWYKFLVQISVLSSTGSSKAQLSWLQYWFACSADKIWLEIYFANQIRNHFISFASFSYDKSKHDIIDLRVSFKPRRLEFEDLKIPCCLIYGKWPFHEIFAWKFMTATFSQIFAWKLMTATFSLTFCLKKFKTAIFSRNFK